MPVHAHMHCIVEIHENFALARQAVREVEAALMIKHRQLMASALWHKEHATVHLHAIAVSNFCNAICNTRTQPLLLDSLKFKCQAHALASSLTYAISC